MLKCLFRRCFSILAIVLGQDQRAALFGICNPEAIIMDLQSNLPPELL